MEERGNMRLLHLSWEDIQRLAEELAERVRASGFRPDVVVAVSRGGFDPARILCDQLSIRLLASLQIDYYADINRRKDAPEIVFPLNTDIPGMTALVVFTIRGRNIQRFIVTSRSGSSMPGTRACNTPKSTEDKVEA